MTTTTLTTGQIISATTGYLACDIGDLYDALNQLTGDNLMTHQLPDASRAVEAHIRKHCPWVDHLPHPPALPGTPEDRRTTVLTWVDNISATHGTTHPLPTAHHLWGTHDPLEDLMDKVGPDRIIVVTPDQTPEDTAAIMKDITRGPRP